MQFCKIFKIGKKHFCALITMTTQLRTRSASSLLEGRDVSNNKRSATNLAARRSASWRCESPLKRRLRKQERQESSLSYAGTSLWKNQLNVLVIKLNEKAFEVCTCILKQYIFLSNNFIKIAEKERKNIRLLFISYYLGSRIPYYEIKTRSPIYFHNAENTALPRL